MSQAFLVTQKAKNPPTKQETQVQSLGWEDLLGKGLATHSSISAWRNPQGNRQATVMGSQRVGHN